MAGANARVDANSGSAAVAARPRVIAIDSRVTPSQIRMFKPITVWRRGPTSESLVSSRSIAAGSALPAAVIGWPAMSPGTSTPSRPRIVGAMSVLSTRPSVCVDSDVSSPENPSPATAMGSSWFRAGGGAANAISRSSPLEARARAAASLTVARATVSPAHGEAQRIVVLPDSSTAIRPARPAPG